MGYEKKIMIKKVENEILWMGEKNLILYDKEFEEPLKEATQRYFAKMADSWSQENSCYEYIIKVAHALKKEEQNCDFMLQYETKSKIIQIIQSELIEKKA
jgi:hypothetical protein